MERETLGTTWLVKYRTRCSVLPHLDVLDKDLEYKGVP